MISAAGLAALMQSAEPHAVLDLRERAAYERGQIFRATLLPRRLLEFRLPRLVPARQTPLVLVDEDGRLAELAHPTLARMGFSDVRILEGGLGAWRAAGRRLVQGVNVPSKVFGERMLHEMKTPEISPEDLQARLDAKADLVLVDSRTPEEYHRGCIPGAWSMPGGELVLRIAELVRSPETTIVVHCGGRTRSYIGAETLRRMKLPNPVMALENGTMGWELAGLTLERGAARWAPPVSERGRALAQQVAARIAAEEGVPFVSPEELRRLWERRDRENAYVLDVRYPDEYAQAHVAGAVSAPGGQAVQATDEHVAVRAAHVILVCDGAGRSVMTASWLRRMGLPRVAVLRGGLPAWVESGGGVERGSPAPVPEGYEAARAAVARVEPRALQAELASDRLPLILDVGASDDYGRGHVPGAAWLCRSRLELRIGEVAPDRTRPVVLTSADGLHSTLAAAALGGLGWSAVRVLEGGTRAWQEAGLPLEQGLTRMMDEADDVLHRPFERGRAWMEAYLRWEEALDPEGQSPHALLPERGGRP